MERMIADVALERTHALAEGPVWDSLSRRVLWVDVMEGELCTARLGEDDRLDLERTQRFGHPVAAVALAADGTRLVVGPQELLVVSPAGGVDEVLALPVPPGSRLNDGKVDPAGRFIVGSLAIDGDSTREKLYLVDRDRSVRVIDEDLTLSNGLGWSPDGLTMYSVDSGRQALFARGYGPAGPTQNRKVLVSFDEGIPDGLAVDAAGYLWVAMWGLGCVNRYSPDGRLVGVVAIPAPLATSTAFAGPGLATLVITSASAGTNQEPAEHPRSGMLFTVRPSVPGKSEALWGGFLP